MRGGQHATAELAAAALLARGERDRGGDHGGQMEPSSSQPHATAADGLRALGVALKRTRLKKSYLVLGHNSANIHF
jgi:hypothetical protein